MMELFTDDLRRDPFPMYDQLRSRSPVFCMPGTDTWMILDYEGVKRALHDHDSFSSVVTPPTGKAPDWLVFSDPPRHTKLRGLITRAFTPRSIASLEPRIRALSAELLDAVIERGETDLLADYAGPLPVMVIAEMIGIPLADRPRFLRWSEAIINLGYSMAGGDAAKLFIEAHALAQQEMSEYVRRVCDERRRDPKDDLLTRLVEAELEGDRLSEADLLGFFQLLLSAGTETTTNVIANGVLCFLDAPDQLARLRADRSLLPTAIEEVIRFRSPGQIMFRQTKKDVDLHGQTIPSNRFVLTVIGSANRDPSAFGEPNRFDVARDPNPHVAFGHGIHFCIGAALARLEAKVAFGDLLDRLPDLARATDAPWEPRKALHLHGPAHLPLRFTPGRRVGAPR